MENCQDKKPKFDPKEHMNHCLRQKINELEKDNHILNTENRIAHERLSAANSAYQRIFDEKVERCKFIKDCGEVIRILLANIDPHDIQQETAEKFAMKFYEKFYEQYEEIFND